MARQPLDQAAKEFLKGDETDAASASPKVTQEDTPPGAESDIVRELSLTPKEKAAPMTITILPSRRKKLETLSQKTGRGMSDLIGIALDRIFEEASIK